MQNVINAVKGTALGVAEYLTPVLKESKFNTTGVLTPEEFVIAGDHLVDKCPTWYWSPGDETMAKPYLPKQKQLLMTMRVPCTNRLMKGKKTDKIVEKETEEGWIETEYSQVAQVEEKIQEMQLEPESSKFDPRAVHEDDDDDDEEAEDMSEFEKKIEHNKPCGDICEESLGRSDFPKCKNPEKIERGEIEIVRTYDLHITYDKFYQTPRMWIEGYDEDGNALRADAIAEDISPDHMQKTVTFEKHPHQLGPLHLCIHPCKHAEMMKKLIGMVEEDGGEVGVHVYLIIFLKFVQTIIPSIDYDYTQNVWMKGAKKK